MSIYQRLLRLFFASILTKASLNSNYRAFRNNKNAVNSKNILSLWSTILYSLGSYGNVLLDNYGMKAFGFAIFLRISRRGNKKKKKRIMCFIQDNSKILILQSHNCKCYKHAVHYICPYQRLLTLFFPLRKVFLNNDSKTFRNKKNTFKI